MKLIYQETPFLYAIAHGEFAGDLETDHLHMSCVPCWPRPHPFTDAVLFFEDCEKSGMKRGDHAPCRVMFENPYYINHKTDGTVIMFNEYDAPFVFVKKSDIDEALKSSIS